jgi:hypothetical protein
MIDPVSVFATACAAYEGVKKAIEIGKEIEGVIGQMSTWWGAASQLREHEEQVKNPPLFRKLLHSGSVEAQALEALVRRKKLQEQERELRHLIIFRYGIDSYREMLEERRKIAASREHLEKRQQARRKKFLENTLCGLALLALSYGMYWLVDFMITHWPEGR